MCGSVCMHVLSQRYIVQMYACVRVNQDFYFSCSASAIQSCCQPTACQLCCAALILTAIPFDHSACLAGKGKKGSKKKAAGKGKGNTSAAPAPPKQSNKNQNQIDAAHSPELTVHALTDKVLEWHPDMEDAGEHSACSICMQVSGMLTVTVCYICCRLIVTTLV